jgi:hypothetical protein
VMSEQKAKSDKMPNNLKEMTPTLIEKKQCQLFQFHSKTFI